GSQALTQGRLQVRSKAPPEANIYTEQLRGQKGVDDSLKRVSTPFGPRPSPLSRDERRLTTSNSPRARDILHAKTHARPHVARLFLQEAVRRRHSVDRVRRRCAGLPVPDAGHGDPIR